MKAIQIKNGVISYYGNHVGIIQDSQAVIDPMFEREDLKNFLEHQQSVQEIKWQNGMFDRLVSCSLQSPE